MAGEDYSGILNYISLRAAYALPLLPRTTPWSSTAGVPNANGAVTIRAGTGLGHTLDVNQLITTVPGSGNTTGGSVVLEAGDAIAINNNAGTQLGAITTTGAVSRLIVPPAARGRGGPESDRT